MGPIKEVVQLFFIACFFISSPLLAAYSNYNSVLIGQEASGMGGAYTALWGDASAVSFYNPASMTRMSGNSLSANVSTFQKLDTTFGDESNFLTAPTRVNKGFFEPVPSSAGSIISYGHFSLGFSLLIPDFSTFSGEIESNNNTTSFLSFTDESLWVGASLALNLSTSTSLGFSAYYTARKFQRSTSDQTKNGNEAEVLIEDKNFTQNSLVYIIGVYHQINSHWSTGLSIRLPSIPISGDGTFFRSEIDTANNSLVDFSNTDLRAETRIPMKIAFGLAYKKPKKYTFSADITYYGEESYQDLDLQIASDAIIHEAIFNFAIGAEYYFKPWLSGRAGFFTNYSSHPTILNFDSQRIGDHINMKGFSANFTYHSSEHTRFTLGGYWTGGDGDSVQSINQQLQQVGKSLQVFSMIVGSSYQF